MSIETLSNIAVILLLSIPILIFIRAAINTYNSENFLQLFILFIITFCSVILFIALYKFLWLKNSTDPSLIHYILKLCTTTSFLPSTLYGIKILKEI